MLNFPTFPFSYSLFEPPENPLLRVKKHQNSRQCSRELLQDGQGPLHKPFLVRWALLVKTVITYLNALITSKWS